VHCVAALSGPTHLADGTQGNVASACKYFLVAVSIEGLAHPHGSSTRQPAPIRSHQVELQRKVIALVLRAGLTHGQLEPDNPIIPNPAQFVAAKNSLRGPATTSHSVTKVNTHVCGSELFVIARHLHGACKSTLLVGCPGSYFYWGLFHDVEVHSTVKN
jgi:hypothetical protein